MSFVDDWWANWLGRGALSAGFDQCAWPKFDVPVSNLMRGPNLCDVPVLGWCSRPHNRKHCAIWITHKRHAIRAAASARPVKNRRAALERARAGEGQIFNSKVRNPHGRKLVVAAARMTNSCQRRSHRGSTHVQTKIGVITASIKHRHGAVGDPEHLGVKAPRTRSVRHGQVKPSGESFVRYANDPK